MMNEKDKKLLFNLVSIQSSTSEDTKINQYIEKKLNEDSSIKIEKDDFGNIYATKGKGKHGYKCIVAHTDTVHTIKPNRMVYVHGDNVFAMASKVSKYSDSSSIAQTGIGGDDRCGVYTCLKAMEDFDNIKSVYFRFEETGCRGSRASNMKFFDDCNFVVQCDRKGNSDFITHTNGVKVASKEFDDKMKDIYKQYGFESCYGIATDVGALKQRGLNVSACNISSGYYDPHSSYETINIKDLQNTYDLVTDMFNTYGDYRFEHKYSRPEPTKYPVTVYSPGYGQTGQFSSSLNRNYFTTALVTSSIITFDVTIGSEARDFHQLGNSRYFKYIDDTIIDFDGLACPKCKSNDTIMYSTADRTFYCSASECNGHLDDETLFKELYIGDADGDYVYNKIYDVWMKKNEAKWSHKFKTYILRKHPM